MKRLLYFPLIYIICVSCITDDYVEGGAPTEAFEALWQTLDEHYCFFDYKEIDWNEVHRRYAPKISDTMSRRALFDTLSRMTCELRDGHVNLISSMNVSRYGRWFDDYPMNFSDSLLRKTLGRTEEYRAASGLQYRVLENDSIGYVRIGSFSSVPASGALYEMFLYMKDCPALILDLRSNPGGLLTAAEALASVFINERTLVGYMQHKTGRGHQDFSKPQPIYLEPSTTVRWLRPVVILTNRRTYSAANAFVMYVQAQPNVLVVGDTTGGGSGMPFSSDLPSGFAVRFSASPMYDRQMQQTEFGIQPDAKQDITPADYANSIDSILERAREILHQHFEKVKEEEL